MDRERATLPPSESLVDGMQLLLKEASGLQEAKDREVENKRGIVEWIRTLQARSHAPILISRDLAGTLGAERGEIEGGELVLAGAGGDLQRTPLDLLDDYAFLAVIEDCASALLDQVSKAAAILTRPVLEVRTGVKGGQVLIFDWRSYRVSLRNVGPEALEVEAVVQVLDKERRFTLEAIGRDGSTDLDLRSFHSLPRTGSLRVEVSCRDSAGREYWGEASVKLGPTDWAPVPLEEKSSSSPQLADA